MNDCERKEEKRYRPWQRARLLLWCLSATPCHEHKEVQALHNPKVPIVASATSSVGIDISRRNKKKLIAHGRFSRDGSAAPAPAAEGAVYAR